MGVRGATIVQKMSRIIEWDQWPKHKTFENVSNCKSICSSTNSESREREHLIKLQMQECLNMATSISAMLQIDKTMQCEYLVLKKIAGKTTIISIMKTKMFI